MSDKLKLAEQEIQKLLRKHGVHLKYRVTFPLYRINPPEVDLALKVLEKHQMHIIVEVEENKSK